MLNDIINICERAGEIIMEIYENGNMNINYKDDLSPLTLADREASDYICKNLKKYNYPIICEETVNISYYERKKHSRLWLVDPLDGTKEFIKKNGEFTVNVALIELCDNGKYYPILGVVYVPVKRKMYYGVKGKGSYIKEEGNTYRINCGVVRDKLRIVCSRSHMNEDTKKYLEQYENYELIGIGSSLKLLMIAEGNADIYPRMGPTMEWDIAAAQAVVEEAGGIVINYDSGERLYYGKQDLRNKYFVVKSGNI